VVCAIYLGRAERAPKAASAIEKFEPSPEAPVVRPYYP
jgi:hypothetical protein